MDATDLIARYPVLFHMAAANSWTSIQKHGLLSTSSLLDLFQVSGGRRRAIESSHRPESVVVEHPVHGRAIIRDQKPMSDAGLRRCLNGITPAQWYNLLNQRVFFWVTEERLQRLLCAKAYRDSDHTVLHVDTSAVVNACHDQITLSPMNSGCTKPYPHARGKGTFLPINEYPFDDWLKKRGRSGEAVVELAVDGGVVRVADFTIRVETRRATKILSVLQER